MVGKNNNPIMSISIITVMYLLLSGFYQAAVADDRITAELGKEKVSHGALLVDVRTPEEFKEAHVEGAINIPYDKISDRLDEIGNDKNREIVLYCRSGRRAGVAQQTLRDKGYSGVFNAGGLDEWTSNEVTK